MHLVHRGQLGDCSQAKRGCKLNEENNQKNNDKIYIRRPQHTDFQTHTDVFESTAYFTVA